MIVLKILLYILLAVLGIILIVLIIPAGGEFSYIDGKFTYKIKLWIFDIMNSEGGGLYKWWKKRKAKKKDKPEKPKKPKPVKDKKPKKKKKREKYEWEKELDNIPVNDPEAESIASEAVSAAEVTASGSVNESITSDVNETAESSEESKKEKKKKHKRKKEDEEYLFDDEYEEESAEDEEKKSFSDKIEKIIDIWESAQRPVLKIFKGFRLSDLYIDFEIADEDACDCALKYGKYSALIYNGIAFFCELFTVRVKTIDVRPAFGVSKGRWDAAGKLYFRLGTLVIAGAWFLITYFFRTFLPEKLRKRKMKKSAARQK